MATMSSLPRSYEEQRQQGTRTDLWPLFRPAPVSAMFDLCPGGVECDCDECWDDDGEATA